MKKTLAIISVLFIFAFSATSAYARGHGRPSVERPLIHSVCGIESCAEAGLHAHDGISYNAHSYGDGHEYHSYCNVADCSVTEYHEHDGAYCFGRGADGGHGGHQMCGGHHRF